MNCILKPKILKNTYTKQPGATKRSAVSATRGTLHQLAFNNTAPSNIIFIVSSGKIIMANGAACRLLGYTKKELLTTSTTAIFDINETSFKKMLQQRMAKRRFPEVVTAIKKSGQLLPCQISSAVFIHDDGIETASTTILDISKSARKQLNEAHGFKG